MVRRLWVSLIGIVVVVTALFIGNIAFDNTPILGLDLQGGVSVILAPNEDASGDDLIVIRDLIREELERTGIAEPDVRVQGQTIVVDLPGVKDQDQALRSVNVSGIVELRPVLPSTSCLGDTTATTLGAPFVDQTTTVAPATTVEGASTTTPMTTPVTTPGSTATTTGGTVAGLRRPQSATPETSPTTTVAPESATAVPQATDTAPDATVDPAAGDSTTIPTIPVPDLETTGSTGNDVLLDLDGNSVCVGPSGASGEVFEKGSAGVQLDSSGNWYVNVTLRADGLSAWNALATECYNGTATCPSTGTGTQGQLAIVLDDVVQSAPVVNQPVFEDEVSITGSFTESEARSLSRVLNRGAFPIAVTAQEARTVSPSAGGDSLRAAVIAGIVGAILVLVLMIAYYRKIAVVVVTGLIVWAMTVFSVASLVSGWTNYALTLAGIIGIIVAVGVTVDSYVVFFERMKDEVRNGRSIRNAAPRSFGATWRTIWTADLVSALGAVVLFWLSVGSVRGFALYLGITVMCDLIVCFFFTRPAVILLCRSKFMKGDHALGLEVAE